MLTETHTAREYFLSGDGRPANGCTSEALGLDDDEVTGAGLYRIPPVAFDRADLKRMISRRRVYEQW